MARIQGHFPALWSPELRREASEFSFLGNFDLPISGGWLLNLIAWLLP
jgi:hypothetical protein